MADSDQVSIDIDLSISGNAAASLSAQAAEVKRLQDALALLTQGEQGAAAAGETVGQALGKSVATARAQVLETTAAVEAARKAALSSSIDQSEGALARVNQAQQQQRQALQQQSQAQALQQQLNPPDYTLTEADQVQGMGMGSIGGRTGALALAGGGGARAGRLIAGLSGQYGALGVAGAAVGSFDAVSGNLAKGIEAMGNSSATAEEQIKAFTSGIPVIGGVINAFFALNDALTGTGEQLRQTAAAAQNAANNLAFVNSVMSINLAGQNRDTKADLAATLARSTPNYGAAPDRSSDPLGYQRWLDNIPAAQKAADNARAIEQAKGELAALQQQNSDEGSLGAVFGGRQAAVDRTGKKVVQLLQTKAIVDQIITENPGSNISFTDPSAAPTAAGFDAAYKEQLSAVNALIEAEKLRETNLKAQQTQAIALVDQEHQARQNLIADAEKQLALVNQAADLAKQQNTALGAMTEADKMIALQSVNQAKDQGLDTLSESQKGLIQKAGGSAWLSQEYNKIGQADVTGVNQQIRDAIALQGQQFTGMSQQELEAKAVTAKADILVNVQIDEELFKDQMRKVMKDFGQVIDANAKKMAADERSRKELQEAAGKPKG